MFSSIWEKSVPFSPNWLTNSRVVRAYSETPAGPYTYVEDVLPPRNGQHWDGRMTHNPSITRWRGRYLLFYTGTTYSGPRPDANTPVPDAQRLEARANQRIGVAVADHPAGPWTRFDQPVLDARPGHWDALMTTNPAPCAADDDHLFLYYKSASSQNTPIQYGISATTTDQLTFERVGEDRPIQFQGAEVYYEDAFVWHEDGLFQMIFNDMTGHFTGEDHAGAHAFSPDGLKWELAPQPKAYSRSILWEDGNRTTQGSFERPQLLIENGRPTHLFAATADGPGHFERASRTWNMVVPLRD